jgi:hypothetical protein
MVAAEPRQNLNNVDDGRSYVHTTNFSSTNSFQNHKLVSRRDRFRWPGVHRTNRYAVTERPISVIVNLRNV